VTPVRTQTRTTATRKVHFTRSLWATRTACGKSLIGTVNRRKYRHDARIEKATCRKCLACSEENR
jgi:hypothetical protein